MTFFVPTSNIKCKEVKSGIPSGEQRRGVRNLFIKTEPQLTEVSRSFFQFLFFGMCFSSWNRVIFPVGPQKLIADQERSTSQISHLQN